MENVLKEALQQTRSPMCVVPSASGAREPSAYRDCSKPWLGGGLAGPL